MSSGLNGGDFTTTDSQWREEQQRVDRATTKIAERMQQLESEVGDIKTDVVTIRKEFWDDVTINLSNSDDIVETHTSLKQQADILFEQEQRVLHATQQLAKLARLVESPYFGRIDFTEDGAREVEHVYIGIGSFIDEDNEFWVYDWRAPISSLYYDYAPGPVAYKAPFGTVTGAMSVKRQFAIRNRQIRLMFDTGLTIGDELLMQVLSRHSDAQMKSIVATIQKEQNLIIRDERSRLLVVQGAAGSGKTSAALQRVAYLLYKYRETLKADQMVLFSPNPLFNSYVSTVLPELGEENMQQTTFTDYLQHRLGQEFDVEDPFSQLEFILTSGETLDYEARISGIYYKSSIRYLNAIHSYRDLLEHEGMIFVPVTFDHQVVMSAGKIQEKFYSFESSMRLSNRMERVRDWILDELSVFAESEIDEDWLEEELNLLDIDDYQLAYKHLHRVQRGEEVTFDDVAREKEFLSRKIVQVRLKPLRSWIKKMNFVDVSALYKQLFSRQDLFAHLVHDSGVPDHWSEICRATVLKLERSELAYEDATPFLYLKELLQGRHSNTTVRHVIVDEAQDYSPFQLEFLKRLFPRCKMTALGDLNQAIYAHDSALTDYTALLGLYGPDQTEVVRLTTSYRSTREIVEFTRGMVAGGEEIVPFNRSGEKPRVTPLADQGVLLEKIADDIESLKTEGYDSIAVICKTASQAAEAQAALSHRLSVRLITKYTPTFEKETLVIPAYLAKGVEFDAVIIYDGSQRQYSRETERKLFYTACTRAMHLLQIYTLGEPSPFITAQPERTYVLDAVAQ
ncbi:MAG: helicase [Alicyclobacillus sp. RIFOXYA1_FULL_53_8]|nr:MAG: helicase [Alicyclobacillus sp. RIFOXYA1_FULL_53_8]